MTGASEQARQCRSAVAGMVRSARCHLPIAHFPWSDSVALEISSRDGYDAFTQPPRQHTAYSQLWRTWRMDDRRFDAIARSLAAGYNRRDVLKRVLGASAGAVAVVALPGIYNRGCATRIQRTDLSYLDALHPRRPRCMLRQRRVRARRGLLHQQHDRQPGILLRSEFGWRLDRVLLHATANERRNPGMRLLIPLR